MSKPQMIFFISYVSKYFVFCLSFLHIGLQKTTMVPNGAKARPPDSDDLGLVLSNLIIICSIYYFLIFSRSYV